MLAAPGSAARAQAADSSCSYARCSLMIMPRIAALDVVRGADESRVTSLAFLWPRTPVAPFATNAGARVHALHALHLRQLGAMLTDAAIGFAVAGAFESRTHRSSHLHASAAAILFAASVPIHFGADAELSRAVREYNAGLVK